MIGKYRGTARAIRQNIMPLIQEILIPQLLHHPPNRLHIRGFHRFIVIIKVNPASQPINRTPPFLHIAQHTRPARLIKLGNTVLFNVGLRVQPQLFFDQVFYRQPMTVPSKPPLNLLPLHRLITRNNILNRTRHKMPKMRQPRCKRRAVKKHVLISPLTLRNRLFKNILFFPKAQNRFFLLREIHLRINRCIHTSYSLSIKGVIWNL